MRSSLLLKFLGAFLLIIIIGGLIISGLILVSTRNAFSLYTTRVGQEWALELVTPLTEYYAYNGSWQGVESILAQETAPGDAQQLGNNEQSPRGRGGGMGFGYRDNQRIILADASDTIVYDTQNQITGESLSAQQVASGVAIELDGQQVGLVIVTQNDSSPLENSATIFLETVNRSIITAALAASLIAIILGVLLFRQIISPIQKMKSVASSIAGGDLSQRVSVGTRDELGDLASALNQMADDLQTAEINRRQMIADIAHELRTPLTIMQANLEGMLDGVLRTDKKHLAILHEESLLLNRLISDLRLLSLAEAGKLVLDKKEIDLSALLLKLLEKFKPVTLERQIQLSFNQEGTLPKVLVDPDRISQVVMNLISNALNFTPKTGSVIVRAKRDGAEIRVSVCDTGTGIPPDELENIFNRFYRLDKSRVRKTGGTGLGLSIAKYLVEAHGGSITATSPIHPESAHPGTCICFSIPL